MYFLRERGTHNHACISVFLKPDFLNYIGTRMPIPLLMLCNIIFFFQIFIYSCSNETVPENKNFPVTRIISLSPSLTGQIIDLGSEDKLVGVTPYHPPLKKDLPHVGTFISPSIEKIILLKPDIIFCSEEDGDVQKNDFFKKSGLRYYRFKRNRDYKSICDNYLVLAGIIGKRDYGEKQVDLYSARLDKIKKSRVDVNVAFLVSAKPLITVSKLSYISGIIRDAGGINVFAETEHPYPILTVESLVTKNPDIVIVMNKGDDIFLFNNLKDFKTVNFIIRKNIFVAGDDIIPYYSPKDYILAVEKISEILTQMH